MAVTKILTRKGRLDIGINYVLNGDKTEERVLTTHLNCDPGREFRQMLDTKRAVGKEDGVQYYHIIQSFKPGEVTPEQALEIATEFAKEHLPGYETVIGVHVDKEHIHAHLVFNSVNADTGEKYHSNAKSYYRQIRAISDRLCREHGLSVLIQGEPSQAVSYIEWLRRSRGQPTFRSMLEEDLRSAMADANDLGHFFLLMEHMGYEISHGNRLGFRLRGQERFMIPGRKNALFTEDGIRATIQGNLAAIEVGRRPAVLPRPQYRPYQKHPKYTGFLALYVHYLYLLGKTGKRQYVKPNILEANTNYVVTDPKQEVLTATGGWLKQNGYEIRVLNLVNLEQSDGYNPFRYLRDEKDALKLVNNLIQATTPKGSHESDPFWTSATRSLAVRSQRTNNKYRCLDNW